MWVWGIFTDFEVNEGMILAKKQAVFAGTKAQGEGWKVCPSHTPATSRVSPVSAFQNEAGSPEDPAP